MPNLKTYSDIHTAVLETANVSSSSSAASTRIGRSINHVNQHLAAIHRWRFLENVGSTVVPAVYKTGAVSISDNSATVTGNASVTFTSAMVGRKLQFNSDNSVYTILSYTDATNVLLSETYQGTTLSAANYRIYQDTYYVATNCEEVIDVWSNQDSYGRPRTLMPLDRRQMINFQLKAPQLEYYPSHWTHPAYDGDSTRKVEIWPAGKTTSDFRLRYAYVARPIDLSAATHVPEMPVSYRNILYYGALEQEYTHQGNMERVRWAAAHYQEILRDMRKDYETTDRRFQLRAVSRGRRRRVTTAHYDLGAAFDTDSYRDD